MAPGAPEIGRIDVEAVNASANRSRYAKRRKIHPRMVRGRFRRLKWIVLCATLGVYYLLPWLRWDRGPGAPDQAVLVDFPGRRFYFFFIEIWPQEIYYVTGLLIVAALALFLVTGVAGRVWCGYACPQTVWTDLFIRIERLVEGDRNARIRLDGMPWTPSKIARRAVKHAAWLVVGAATGGAWVFYFADAPTLAAAFLRFDAPLVSYAFAGLLTAATYLLAGHAREQVCTFMCPWPRIQGAMLDRHSMLVTYRARRGEPRGRGRDREGLGDCVDCNSCVAVCPMGIDIRDGDQLECINCALCIDACDDVMDRIGRPRGLIAYDTLSGERRLLRPRLTLYAALIVIAGAVMLGALGSRENMQITVLRDRTPLFVQLSNGDFRNGYTLKILNKRGAARRFGVSLAGLPGGRLSAVGSDPASVEVGPGRLRSLRVHVTASGAGAGVAEFEFVVVDRESGDRHSRRTTFRRGA